MIKQFKGEHAFLSNFYPSPIDFEGQTYPTVEHAFQAAKTNDPEIRRKIAEKETPGKAKRAGGRRGIIKDFDFQAWEAKKVETMRQLVRRKFEDPELRQKLRETGDQTLQEGNHWNDTFWGISLKTGTLERRQRKRSRTKLSSGYPARTSERNRMGVWIKP